MVLDTGVEFREGDGQQCVAIRAECRRKQNYDWSMSGAIGGA